jgi:glycosyltransferase involved in cell wall biosynthesis
VIATALGWIMLAPVGTMLAILDVELLASLGGRRRRHMVNAATRPTVAVLMPAHNEGKRIAPIIAKLLPQLAEGNRLIVVADNCSDDTAAVAKAAGAEVIERFDPHRRGKGYALDFGRNHLRNSLPDCVVVLDADCWFEPGSLDLIASEAVRNGDAVQSCYLMRPDFSSPMVEISNFAFLIKNRIRLRGMTRLGAPSLLGGTGMAFDWKLFDDAPLATGDLVEDLALAIDFVKMGKPPRFVEHAQTWSEHAAEGDTLAQRTRWEHGFVTTARRNALPLLAEGVRKMSFAQLWLGAHLMVPPLAFLMALSGIALAAELGVIFLGASPLPAALLASLLLATTLLLGISWAREGRSMLAASTLLRIPLYILWKIPIYLRLVRKPETQWQRTRRQGEAED